MRYIVVLIISIYYITSCSPKIYETNSGKMISQKKLHRIANRALKQAQKKLSKEDLETLNSIEYYKVDTINVSGN